MCGISAIVAPTGGKGGASADAARSMAHRLGHRGPDRVSAWASTDGGCALGHARLEVIDLVTGDQPMATEDGTTHVVFNGEIYNHRELRRELEASGHRFRTRSDTEVLLHGYRAWGDGIPTRLEGMFAFAVWDARRRRLFAARDRAGEKPIFWSHVGGRFALASEIKALLALPWIDGSIEPDVLDRYLAFGYVPAPDTFYRGVHKLPPGSVLVVQDGQVSTSRYWRLDWSPRRSPGGSKGARGELRTLFDEAVARRLEADVPLGAFLSGGIDSTLVVAAATRHRKEPLRTFSLGFADDPTYDETEYAREASRRFGTDHTELRVEAGSIGLLDALVDAYDEPFGDSSAIPTYLVSKLAREHVTVALTGDGGDELFCGYPRMAGMAVAERVPPWVGRIGAKLARTLPHHGDFRHPTRRIRRFLEALPLPPAERMLRWVGVLPSHGSLLRPELRQRTSPDTVWESLEVAWREGGDRSPLTRAMAMTFETYLPDDLLAKTDRCSMAHGLELRTPFLDTALMEFAAGLPDRMRVRRGALKWLLRSAFPEVLPPSIAHRRKQGFGVPLPVWFRTHWREPFEDQVLSETARVRDWLLQDPIRDLWNRHQSGREDHGHALWALLTLEIWLRGRAR